MHSGGYRLLLNCQIVPNVLPVGLLICLRIYFSCTSFNVHSNSIAQERLKGHTQEHKMDRTLAENTKTWYLSRGLTFSFLWLASVKSLLKGKAFPPWHLGPPLNCKSVGNRSCGLLQNYLFCWKVCQYLSGSRASSEGFHTTLLSPAIPPDQWPPARRTIQS